MATFPEYGLLTPPEPKEEASFETQILNNISVNNNRLQQLRQFFLQKAMAVPTTVVKTEAATPVTEQNATAQSTPSTSSTGTATEKLMDFVSEFEGGKKFGQILKDKELTGYRLHDNKGDHKTFGYGLLYHPDGGFMDAKKDSYTQKELEDLYKKTLQKGVDKVTNWASKHNVKLNDNQIAAIASACYNFGDGFLNKQIMKKIAANPNDPSIKTDWEHLSDSQLGRFPGLKRRRVAEAVMFFSK